MLYACLCIIIEVNYLCVYACVCVCVFYYKKIYGYGLGKGLGRRVFPINCYSGVCTERKHKLPDTKLDSTKTVQRVHQDNCYLEIYPYIWLIVTN